MFVIIIIESSAPTCFEGKCRLVNEMWVPYKTAETDEHILVWFIIIFIWSKDFVSFDFFYSAYADDIKR